MRLYVLIWILLTSCLLTLGANGRIVSRQCPDKWNKLVYGGRFMDRFLAMPAQGKLSSETWGADVSYTHISWIIELRGEALSVPIIVGEYLYRLRKLGFLQCWEMATGKEIYSARLAGISTTWASPIANPKGRLFFANVGKSYVIQAGPECRILVINDRGDGNYPSPAMAKGRLFLVGMKNIFCIDTEHTGTPK